MYLNSNCIISKCFQPKILKITKVAKLVSILINVKTIRMKIVKSGSNN